ncbi:cupredoxin domain-containing protein [Inquilinus sp. Marseille-Q2685]|uniref:cupredoxin domain-containing protein n=1 Tax=Inquilinus sp. Marseille-Q2685 TaxID=2866581 RepID=UPI001CE43FCE|nr:cupredoxin family protein [Inquilinus sp. Marseille-Q2685]
MTNIIKSGHAQGLTAAVLSASVFMTASFAFADAGHSGTKSIGEPPTGRTTTRVVEITIKDSAYEPKAVRVKAGETVRFVLKNEGELLHEFNLGTAEMHAEHQHEMQTMVEHGMLTPTAVVATSMPGMSHDDPNAVFIEPGKTAELSWTFPAGGTIEFACNIPGHYESGMVGKIVFSS